MKTITAKCIALGHLRYGKLTLKLNEADYEEFCKADKSEQEEWLKECSTFELTDWELDDIDEIHDIRI